MRNLILSLLPLALLGSGCAHQKPTAVFQPVPGMADRTAASAPAAPALPPKATPAVPAPSPEAAPAPVASAPAAAESPIVTPETGLTGKVASYNEAGRFVVIDFPAGRLPAAGQRLFVYRQGLKTGELIVSEWNRDHYVVADVVTGDARKDDEARDK